MPTPTSRELGSGRLLVDLKFRDSEGLIASYLIPEPGGTWTLVETGPTTCAGPLDAGVRDAGVAPQEVRRVFVTHIHLDHAGGGGALLKRYPQATLYVHASGLPHLVDPARLISSARRAWGPSSDALWGPIEPADSRRVVALSGGERFPVSGGDLEVMATPGHAVHHLSFFDHATGALLTGDSAGVRLPGGWRSRPSLPPPDLDLEALFTSLDRMVAAHPRALWYSHFGPSPKGAADLFEYRRAVTEWADAALEAARADPTVGHVAQALEAAENDAAKMAGAVVASSDRTEWISGYEMTAMGLLRYFRTRGLVSG